MAARDSFTGDGDEDVDADGKGNIQCLAQSLFMMRNGRAVMVEYSTWLPRGGQEELAMAWQSHA